MIYKKYIIGLICLVLGVFGFIVVPAYISKHQASPVARATIAIKGVQLRARIAVTPDDRARGLGGVKNLGANEAMLFAFDTPAMNSFWMKDMLFPIDIIWVGENERVIGLTTDIQPSSFPKSYQPPAPALYVIETDGGWVTSHEVLLGDPINIQL